MRIAARLHSLEELEASQEGYFGGVRAVKEAVRHNKLPPDYRVVADVLRVPEGLETAIEVALGSSAQDLVTSDEASAKRAIEYLKHTRSGRATFLPLSRMRSNRDPLVLGRAASLRGVLGAAIDLVKFPPGDTAAIETLLARTIVCEDLDAAVAAADIVRGWSRVVTCAGEVLSPNGAMTGGDNQKRGLGLIARKTRMAALETERREAQQHADSLRDQERAIAERQAAAGRQVGERRGAAQEARVATARAEETLRQAERDVKRLDQAIAEQGRRSDAAGSILERARTERTKVADRVASLARAAEGEDQFGSRNAEELARIGAERESLQARITQERVSLAGLSEKAQGQAKASRMARSEADRLKTQVSERRKQTEETRTEEGVLIRQAGARAQARADAATRMSAAQAKLAAVSATFNERSQTVATLTSGVHELQEGRATSLDAIRKMEQRETRWEMTRSQLSARLLEEYGATVSEVLGLEKDPAVAPDTPREVARLRRELRALGDVNVSACEEYEKLSERHRFLSAQRQDSEEARDRLLAAIREIDDSTRGVFMETFKAVGVAFQEIFGRLFRGGITELKLTDPENLLETGVEVMVQPPGKKKQSLMLLSGGERALTAAALLFAFLRVRPAPFCVLDEVDAPLDGVNVERFAQLMKEFGERTQFLCITHNPSTMEAAPVWYGVTMQEPGISHVLSLSIPAVGQASPAQDESPKKLVA
jgi:chromosome segregation protein